jgi:5-methyltetrahydropteroyltriglutamate--homocysteine methyltransferase
MIVIILILSRKQKEVIMRQKTLITGFPRIGEKRELKKALEKYWGGKISCDKLLTTAYELRKKHWIFQKKAGVDFISCNDFSLYDGMLDTIIMLNAVPDRFKDIENPLQLYFAMARGTDKIRAMEMTKWFNTNYHYIVPELDSSIKFHLNPFKIISEYKEAKELGIENPKINIIGPLTFLGLSKTKNRKSTYEYFDMILPIYVKLLEILSEIDKTVYIQMEEPIFVKGPNTKQIELLKICYKMLTSVKKNIKLIVTTYFEHSKEATEALSEIPLWGIGLDFVQGKKNLESLDYIKDKKLIAGVIDGRNIWINDLKNSIGLLNSITSKIKKEQIIISTSCSLLHLPFTIKNEPPSKITKWLAFAYEKVEELVLLKKIFHFEEIPLDDIEKLKTNTYIISKKLSSEIIINKKVRDKVARIKNRKREGNFSERIKIQKTTLNLPKLPTTTIGSFPQTTELRKLRKNFKKGLISEVKYEEGIKKYIDKCIAFQEDIGLDVFVHGEPERNDMVEYFGEMLEGFHFTENGWVQSYGSRCVKPPIIYGDINRSKPMTVKWIKYAQSRTEKPVKGILTGPVTIMQWSFIRNDICRSRISEQIAVVLRDEIEDLQTAGIKIIQVDEAAFKEGYPLRKENIEEYERWAVENFKLTVSKAKKETQIHTHMCYSEFNDIIKTIEAMDADVISIETARSGNKLLQIFSKAGYKNEIGPGVYDIHSPRIPSVEEFSEQIKLRLEVLPQEQLWINPDCGLKTRKWEEVKPALKNMVKAVKKIRQ